MKAVVNGTLVLEDRLIPDGTVLIDGALICAAGPAFQIPVPPSAEIIDAAGGYVGPGFIDLHCHGGGGFWWHEDPAAYAAAHLRHGSTGLLATSGMYRDLDELLAGLDRTAEAMVSGQAPNLLGVQMEGPYKNPKYGAQPELSVAVKPDEYRKILEHGKDSIRIWTIAPELDGIADFIAQVSRYGHILSVGHSEAAPEEILQYISQGLVLACHALDATGTSPKLHGEGGTRNVSVDDIVMLEDRITAEVIPDAGGVHVRPELLRLLVKVKGVDRVAVITDGTKDSGNGDAVAVSDSSCPDLNFNEHGLCGSRLTMDGAAVNMLRHTGVSLPELFRMTSLVPARVLHRDHALGSIRPWKYADLVILDTDLKLADVIFHGERIRDACV